jgi:acetyl-CoA synthetase
MAARIHSLSGYIHEYQQSIVDPERFWTKVADDFYWRERWTKVVEWEFETPQVRWFIDAKLNITENIFERRLFTHAKKPAILWEPNDPNDKVVTLSYEELHTKVCEFANGLSSLGVTQGDRVVLYMPLVPEAIIAMLACARLGAIHSVVFAGFSAQSLSERIQDCQAKVVITADLSFRGPKSFPLKQLVDDALLGCNSVERVVTLKRGNESILMKPGRDVWWHEVIADQSQIHDAVSVDSEDALFILYTSGSTGRPKGVVHSTAGYMVYTAFSFQNVFQYEAGDIYWCTADIGWITGHSYLVYGPLLCGATILIYEGIPTFPHPGRYWEIIDKYQVSQFYTAPTAIRSLQACGLEPIQDYKLSSLKTLGTVGEPINEDAWRWYHTHIGKGRCPIVDTWWQTETGGIMISPLAGITPTKPTCATLPLPGVQPVLIDNEGQELHGNGVEGNLCIKFPWPSMLRTIYGDHDRCRETYFTHFRGMYFTGDGAKRDEDGYYRILGRVDDVINVSGHRLGTAEIENALNEHPRVVESAVVGFPHPIKGQGICAFVVCDLSTRTEENLTTELKLTVTNAIGALARPDKVLFAPELPKTRSGKIMRRILRKLAGGETESLGDVSTLLNPAIIEVLTKLCDGSN